MSTTAAVTASTTAATTALPTLLTSRMQAVNNKKDLPVEYTLPIFVRNTFIDTSLELSPSVEHFLARREVNTCPSAHVGRFRGLYDNLDLTEDDEEEGLKADASTPETGSVSASSPSAASTSPPTVTISLAQVLESASWDQPAGARMTHSEAEPWCFGNTNVSGCSSHWQNPATVAQVAAETAVVPPPPPHPALGSEELPTIGSAGHEDGSCKPCAFFHTVGCTNGLSCQFCHICDSEERRRRRKAKLEARKACKQNRAATGQ